MEPPSLSDREQLRRSKSARDERIAFAKRIGNQKGNSYRFREAIIRTARRHFQARGIAEDRLNRFAARAPPPAWKGMPTTGPVRTFALLIEFPEYPHSNEAKKINDALFGSPATGKPYESLARYYQRASYGQLDLSCGTTLGWYKTDKKRSEIIQDDNGRESLIKEALLHFKAEGHDFAQYDNDNDGFIDYFMVLWAGPDNGWANFWWGYQTEFSEPGFTLDGKSLKAYSWQWECRPVGSKFNTRVVIHETGHALGLPDLYDYDESVGPDGGVGGADMMDANQFDLNCFFKWMLDWLKPTVISSGTQTLALNPSGTSPDCVVVWPFLEGGAIFSEFFMVQYRQNDGNDEPLPGQGLWIWHIDASLEPSGWNFIFDNSWAPHKIVRLMEADGLEQIEANGNFEPGDLYTEGKVFSPDTTPSSVRYDGRSSLVEVSGIAPSGSQISATFRVESAVKGMALAIGLNAVDPTHYDGWSGELIACEQDAADMSGIAASQGFAVTTLLTRDATRARVLAELARAAETLRSGDIFMLSYSGHGGQLPDLNQDEIDAQDETWCLFDGQVVDDELNEAYAKFAEGVRILVFSDSCHSGTVTKEAFYTGNFPVTGQEQVRYRYMPRLIAQRVYRKNKEFYDPILKKPGLTGSEAAVQASVMLISGCQDNQLSSDGDFNGLFTGRLLEVWREGQFEGDYRKFHSDILNRMPYYQSPNYYRTGRLDEHFDNQRPFTI